MPIPVSYTHLDVYKRQACQSKSRRINGGYEWEVVTGGSISLGPKPRRISIVSKTHEQIKE